MNANCYLHSSTSISSSQKSDGKVQISSFGTDDNVIHKTRDTTNDKPIPFLRRLIDMLQDNESVISFHPGVRKKSSQNIPGRIVVHDRSKVESEILPRYFNHASFASLRRQLNYFAFTRVGKGKQKGATYCNDKVIDLLDILSLKRRVVGSSSSAPSSVIQESKSSGTSKKEGRNNSSETKRSSGSISPSSHAISVDSRTRSNQKNGKSSKKVVKRKKTSKTTKRIIDSVVPVVHLPKPKRMKVEDPTLQSQWNTSGHKNQVSAANALSVSVSPPPGDNPFNYGNATGPAELRITLDLTKPPSSSDHFQDTLSSFKRLSQDNNRTHNTKEADVLAGCSALLALGCTSS